MSHASHEDEVFLRNYFGFWIYLLTDCILFGALFATYIVLLPNVAAGPTAAEVTQKTPAFVATLFLVTSSFFYSLVRFVQKKWAILFFSILTALFGGFFLVWTGRELQAILAQGYSWQTSGFLSAFFTLMGVHALHLIAAFFWLFILMIQLFCLPSHSDRGSLNVHLHRRLSCWVLFWQFLALIWIFQYTLIYLIGAPS